ncbi:MAG: molecular chaperone TorD family protein [Gammaproteobacteria bacterium]|nr:molecular chaperone TorD family protein [Gammaproteobacteria bacterium]
MSDDNKVWRAQTYALLANLFAQAPSQILLDHIVAVEVTEPESPMGKQWLNLVSVANKVTIATLEDEYQTLFIGVTHGELIPYGSYYQTGFLMEEPLAELRTDLAKLGLVKHEDAAEPEDHISAQCDVMRLILMAEGTPIVTDKDFFLHHLKPWLTNFFTDLASTKTSEFYRAIGEFGKVFINMELSEYR